MAFAAEMESLHPNVMAIYGKMSLGEEMNLISNLDCVVSMDSLVMHLAALTATPVVSVWGATHPSLGFMGYGCNLDNVIQLEMNCRPCSVYGQKRCKYGDYRCINNISPHLIAEKVSEIIDAN